MPGNKYDDDQLVLQTCVFLDWPNGIITHMRAHTHKIKSSLIKHNTQHISTWTRIHSNEFSQQLSARPHREKNKILIHGSMLCERFTSSTQIASSTLPTWTTTTSTLWCPRHIAIYAYDSFKLESNKYFCIWNWKIFVLPSSTSGVCNARTSVENTLT